MSTTTGYTIAEAIERNRAWRERIADTVPEDAQDAAFDKCLDEALILQAAAGEYGPDTKLPTYRDVAYGNTSIWFSDAERWAILWQYEAHLDLGSFTHHLLKAAGDADSTNLAALAKGFPALVEGIHRWRNESGFADRIRAILALSA